MLVVVDFVQSWQKCAVNRWNGWGPGSLRLPGEMLNNQKQMYSDMPNLRSCQLQGKWQSEAYWSQQLDRAVAYGRAFLLQDQARPGRMLQCSTRVCEMTTRCFHPSPIDSVDVLESITSNLLHSAAILVSLLSQFLEEVSFTEVIYLKNPRTQVRLRFLGSKNCKNRTNCRYLHPDFLTNGSKGFALIRRVAGSSSW